MFKSLVLACVLCSSQLLWAEAANPLSVHVLNMQTGTPSTKLDVILEAQQADQWVQINQAQTDAQGRISALYPPDTPLKKGVYKATFKTGPWFKAQNQRSFFPEIPVVFVIDGTLEHYHIPLLLSPYGYSTYRGQ